MLKCQRNLHYFVRLQKQLYQQTDPLQFKKIIIKTATLIKATINGLLTSPEDLLTRIIGGGMGKLGTETDLNFGTEDLLTVLLEVFLDLEDLLEADLLLTALLLVTFLAVVLFLIELLTSK